MPPTIRPLVGPTNCRWWSHVSNVLTTYSAVFKVMMCTFLWRGSIKGYMLSASGAYLFDCLDGQYARAYGMVSKFGDYYDHITDVGSMVGLLVILAVRYRPHIAVGHVGLYVVLLFLLAVSTGCSRRGSFFLEKKRPSNQRQSKKTDNAHDESIDVFQAACPSLYSGNGLSMPSTRCFGSGTFVFLFHLLVIHIMLRSKPKL